MLSPASWSRKWQRDSVFLLENSMDREAWWAAVHVVTKSQTQTEQVNAHAQAHTPPAMRKHMYKSLHGHMLSFLLGKHIGVK